jgi:hypothetical protein
LFALKNYFNGEIEIDQDYGYVSVDGHVRLLYYTNTLPVKFAEVRGNFTIDNCDLNSLEGCPHTVDGEFFCGDNHLTDFKGGPSRVGYFSAVNNPLTSLKGAPAHVEGDFRCNYNRRPLTSFEGAPAFVGGSFWCRRSTDINLDSLKGVPDHVGEQFLIDYSPKLPLLRALQYPSALFLQCSCSCDSNYT